MKSLKNIFSIMSIVLVFSCSSLNENKLLIEVVNDTIHCVPSSVEWKIKVRNKESGKSYRWTSFYADSILIDEFREIKDSVNMVLKFPKGQPQIPTGENYLIFALQELEGDSIVNLYTERVYVNLEDCNTSRSPEQNLKGK